MTAIRQNHNKGRKRLNIREFLEYATATTPVQQLSAHAVHFWQHVKKSKKTGGEKRSTPVIYKENKHGRKKASKHELLLSEMALLFLKPGLTPPSYEVTDEHGKTLGIAVKNMQTIIPTDTKYIDCAGNLCDNHRFIVADSTKLFQELDLKTLIPETTESAYIQHGTNLYYINKKLNIQESVSISLENLTKLKDELHGYDLSLMSDNPLEKNVLEFECTDEGFKYRICIGDSPDKIAQKTIPWDQLPEKFPKKNEIILQDKAKYLPEILALIPKKDDTQLKQIKAADPKNQLLSAGALARIKQYTHHKPPADKKFRFLNEMPDGFFANLLKQHNDKSINIDMESLASVLGTSYVLEEDDLHKGNIGFYVVEEKEIKKYVFFKIDHDLMMANSIMSHMDSRINNLLYTEKSFNITARDLLNFPDLKDSHNHYWPTRLRWMVKYGDNKIYRNAAERDAFKSLKNNEEFNQYKWKHFYKYILLPEEVLQQAATAHLNPNDPKEAAEINLVKHAVIERLAQLRAILFSMPEFRNYVTNNTDLQAIKEEISNYLTTLKKDDKFINKALTTVNARAQTYQILKDDIQEGDTPLHIAIRLKEYRLEQSFKAFGEYINTKNKIGQTPLELAAEMAKNFDINTSVATPGENPLLVMRNLIYHGAHSNKINRHQIQVNNSDVYVNLKTYNFIPAYLAQEDNAYAYKELKSFELLKEALSKIGNDCELTLGLKKKLAKQLVKANIHHLDKNALEALQTALNGSQDENGNKCPRAAELKFISQRRNSLWLIRKFLGLYGKSNTQQYINHQITNRWKELYPDNATATLAPMTSGMIG